MAEPLQTRPRKDPPPSCRTGHAFRNGKAYWFDRKRIVVARGWPAPLAWYKTPARPWKPTRKWADDTVGRLLASPEDQERRLAALAGREELQAGLPPDDEFRGANEWMIRLDRERYEVARKFSATIPPEVLDEVLRYGDRRWHMLCLFARCPGALDLSRSNPALAFALASNWAFHLPAVKQPMRAARSLLIRRQREILAWLRFPASETARRILRKIEPTSLSVLSLLYLRDALVRTEVVRVLSHLPRINAGALRLMTSPRLCPLVSPRLAFDVACDPREDELRPPVLPLLRDTLRMQRQCNVPARRFESMGHLRRLHDELSRRVNEVDWSRIREELPASFGPPPFPGTDSILPLTTPEELRDEGIEMGHCVASHAPSIAAGHEYVYRVLSPVRATLAIRPIGGGRWELQELRGIGNALVDPSVRNSLLGSLFEVGGLGSCA